MNRRLPTYYIPHGGGPCFFIKPEDQHPMMPEGMWDNLENYLRGIDKAVGRRPKAVLVVTAHWMTPRPTIGNAAQHHLLYDYSGFPEYTYRFDYTPQGAPEIAARIAELLAEAGIASDMDSERGIDHGVFVPLMLVYPDGDVPLIPMSLQQNLDGAEHVAIGKALEKLRDEDVLILGSGMSYHNQRAMMDRNHEPSKAFDIWLGDATGSPASERDAALGAWDKAPGALNAHPPGGEEHLIPLMVAAGAAGNDQGRRSFGDLLGGKPLSGFTFG